MTPSSIVREAFFTSLAQRGQAARMRDVNVQKERSSGSRVHLQLWHDVDDTVPSASARHRKTVDILEGMTKISCGSCTGITHESPVSYSATYVTPMTSKISQLRKSFIAAKNAS